MAAVVNAGDASNGSPARRPAPLLPVELISLIAEEVDRRVRIDHLDHPGLYDFRSRPPAAHTQGSLLSLSKVSRVWRKATWPVLLRHAAFVAFDPLSSTVHSAFAFCAFVLPRGAELVRSVELDLRIPDTPTALALNDAQFDGLLELLPLISALSLRSMHNLPRLPRLSARLRRGVPGLEHVRVHISGPGPRAAGAVHAIPSLVPRSLKTLELVSPLPLDWTWGFISAFPRLEDVALVGPKVANTPPSASLEIRLARGALGFKRIHLGNGSGDHGGLELIRATRLSLESLSLHNAHVSTILSALVPDTRLSELRKLHVCPSDPLDDFPTLNVIGELQAPALEYLSVTGGAKIFFRLAFLVSSRKFPRLREVAVGRRAGEEMGSEVEVDMLKQMVGQVGVTVRFHPKEYELAV